MRRAEARERRLAASQSHEAAAEAAPRAMRAAKPRDPVMYEWLQVSGRPKPCTLHLHLCNAVQPWGPPEFCTCGGDLRVY